jgi:hypothetical protein
VVKKYQVPVMGGLRKVIQPGTNTSDAAIATLQAQVTQLAAAIAGLAPPPNTQSDGSSGSIVLGPGLSGGGSLVGAVPIRLTQPMALLGDFDDHGEPYIPLQGPIGLTGPQGVPGTGGTGGEITLIEENYSDEPAILPILSFAMTSSSGGGYTPGTIQLMESGGWNSPSALLLSQCIAQDIVIPFACTLREVIVLTQGPQVSGVPTVVSGSCQVDMLHTTFVGFPGSLTDMTGGNPPTITTSGVPYTNTTFVGWGVTTLAQNDVIRVLLQSVSLFASVKIILRIY